jgi:CRP-like cAMP-binding protein
MQSLEAVLTGIDFFKGMKPDHLALVAGCAANVHYEAGEFVGRAGDLADTFWVLREGRMALELSEPGRGTITVATMSPGDVVGFSWLLPPYQLHFDVHVLTSTRALRFDGRCLRGKFEHDHELGYELMKRFAQVIVQRLEATGLQLLDVYGDA